MDTTSAASGRSGAEPAVERPESRATQRIAVPFKGTGSGVGPLSWGQWELWEGIQRLGTWMPLTVIQPLPSGTTVPDIASGLRFKMSRYQTMRTKLRIDPDGPKQVIAAEGEIDLEIVDTDEDPAKVAEQVAERYRTSHLDLTAEWPLRMAVIRHQAVPTHQVVVGSRLTTDAAGGAVIAADLAARDPVTGEVPYPPASMQPLEQARWQRSPAGQQQNATALRYWERMLRTAPAHRLPGSTDPRRPRYWRAGFTSPATHLAVRAIAARTGMRAAPILLAAYAVALARVTGINPVMTRVIVNNRFRPGLAGPVCPLAQTGPFLVDVARTTFAEVLARTQRRTMATYKYAYHDPAQLYELVARVSRERGEQVHIGTFFDDRRLAGQPAAAEPGTAAPPPTADQIRAALPRACLRWEAQQDEPTEELFVHVNSAPDTIDMSIQADTHHLSPAGIEAFLRGIETVAVEAASDPVAPTRVPATVPSMVATA